MKIPSDSHITLGIKCQDCRLIPSMFRVRPTVEDVLNTSDLNETVELNYDDELLLWPVMMI